MGVGLRKGKMMDTISVTGWAFCFVFTH